MVMGELAVQVSLFGEVVEARVFRVKGPVVFGGGPDAKLKFPGPAVVVRRQGSDIEVLGRFLSEGETVTIDAGSVEVEFMHTPSIRRHVSMSGGIDRGFLAVAVVMVLAGGWIDAAHDWIMTRSSSLSITPPPVPSSADVLPAMALPNVSGERASVRSAGAGPSDGPGHVGDDRITGIGYNRWFKAVVPTDPNAVQADRRLEVSPDDVEARRIVARAAYNAGLFYLSSWHYQQVIDRHPDDFHARLRLAWSERRQGHHQEEMMLYGEILAEQPDNPLALGGLAMAMARLGHVEAAQDALDDLYVAAPDHPYVDLTAAVLESIQGQTDASLLSLRRSVERRELLGEELQIELRRDIATDPVFSALRSSWRLRAMLRRNLGAASPRGAR